MIIVHDEEEHLWSLKCFFRMFSLYIFDKLLLPRSYYHCYKSSALQENLSERFATTKPAKTWNFYIYLNEIFIVATGNTELYC